MMFTSPSIDWLAAAPVLIVLGAGVVGILVEALAPRWSRRIIQLALSVAALALSLLSIVLLALSHEDHTGVVRTPDYGAEAFGIVITPVTLFLMGSILVAGFLSLLLLAERGRNGELDPFTPQAAAVPGSSYERLAYQAKLSHTEVFPLTLFAIGGMMTFAAAADLITMFVALEVFSLPLYIMCGLERRRLLSQEAALKYFLLGAFSSAIFIFGIAIIYGVTGAVSIPNLSQVFASNAGYDFANLLPMFVVGVAMILAGLLFKVGAVPFHSWTPDVYQGAPTPITGFMAACTKMAAFGALLRILLEAFLGAGESWSTFMVLASAATMIVGSLVILQQTDMKRMLAYSSIAHAGFILTALVAAPTQLEQYDHAVSSVLFYVLAYGLSTVAAFGLVSLVRERRADGSIGSEASGLAQWAGLGKKSPLFAASFSALLLAFAGIPLTSGFMAKFGVFRAAVESGHAWLAVLGVVCSAITAYMYFRVAMVMYFSDPEPGSRTTVVAAPMASAAIGMGIVATILLGVIPGPVLALTQIVQAAP